MQRHVMGLAAFALLLGATGQAKADFEFDSLTVAGTNIKNTKVENEFLHRNMGEPPKGFKPMTIFFTEPAGEGDSIIEKLRGEDVKDLKISDVLTIKAAAGKLIVWFASDGADEALLEKFPIVGGKINKVFKEEEKAKGNQVGKKFGYGNDGAVVVKSDVGVPEPASWLLLGSGLVGLLGCGRWRRARVA